MKKILTLIMCSWLTIAGYGQKYYSGNPTSSIFLQGGMTSSDLVHNGQSSRRIVSPTAGLMYSFSAHKKINVNLGLQLAGRGFQTDKPIAKHRFYYFDVPFYLQYKLSDDLRFDLGAQYSTFISGRSTVLDGNKSNGITKIKAGSALIPKEVAGFLGVEFRVFDSVDLSARYVLSLDAFQNQPSFNSIELRLSYTMVSFYSKANSNYRLANSH